MNIELTKFAERQLQTGHKGVVVTRDDVKQLIKLACSEGIIHSGYANFNQIISIKNLLNDGSYRFSHLKSLVIAKEKIKAFGGSFITGYEARGPEELAVLVEWVEGVKPQIAPWIQLILYNKEQMKKEKQPIQADWGIVGISSGIREAIDPMKPATMLRNALGVDEGGSGERINRQAYEKSVNFWQKNIIIRL